MQQACKIHKSTSLYRANGEDSYGEYFARVSVFGWDHCTGLEAGTSIFIVRVYLLNYVYGFAKSTNTVRYRRER